MLTPTDLERERYEARRKAQLDRNSDLNEARREGEAQVRIERIHLCERLLHRPETPSKQLAALSFEDLKRLVDELQAEVLTPR